MASEELPERIRADPPGLRPQRGGLLPVQQALAAEILRQTQCQTAAAGQQGQIGTGLAQRQQVRIFQGVGYGKPSQRMDSWIWKTCRKRKNTPPASRAFSASPFASGLLSVRRVNRAKSSRKVLRLKPSQGRARR